MPSREDTKVRRVVPNEQAWAEMPHKWVSTDECANVKVLRREPGAQTVGKLW